MIMRKSIRNFILIGAGLLLSGGVLAAMAAVDAQSTKVTSKMATYTVQRAPLSITLTESGTVKSRDQYVVKNQVEGRTSIIYVIDEGTVVEEGELLVELDASELEDRLVDQQIQVENSEADYVSAKESLEVVKLQTQSNVAQATLDNDFAIEDKEKYLKGEWPAQLMEAETDVTLKDEELRRTTDEFKWSERLYEEKYLSETEYRADELAMKRAQLQLALSKENLNLLKEFTHKRRLAELDSNIEQMGLNLERVQREAASDLVQAQARLRAREAELKRQQDRLAKIEDQIAKTKMFAPANGMVVYATSSEFSWRGDTEPLDEGQEVRERQELIHLPTADSMMVRMQIHESSLGKVKIGQPVRIRIDALPESSFTGRVTKIAPLPDAQSVFMNPDLKVYDTDVMIDGVHPQLRTGMSCQATILIEDHLDAIAVPLQSVVGRGNQSLVYVVSGNEAVARPVVTGLDNNAMIHIVDGLKPGEKVLLVPPLSDDITLADARRDSGSFTQEGKNPQDTSMPNGQGSSDRGGAAQPSQRRSGRPQGGSGTQP